MTHSRRELAALLEQHGVRPSRALGQNFVADANTVRKIAKLADVHAGDRVIEVGAGLGSLSLALLEHDVELTCIELDKHLLPALRVVVLDRAEVIEGDALSFDYRALLGDKTATLVANLPYNIATPLVADLLDEVPQLSRMLILVQREVAERLAASPGSGAYGAVSVKVRYWAEAKVVGKVPATVFVPKPNVESALVQIVRRSKPAVQLQPDDLHAFFGMVRTGFGQRRKTLRNSLSGLVSEDSFVAAGIDPKSRAEELDVAQWAKLFSCSSHRQN